MTVQRPEFWVNVDTHALLTANGGNYAAVDAYTGSPICVASHRKVARGSVDQPARNRAPCRQGFLIGSGDSSSVLNPILEKDNSTLGGFRALSVGGGRGTGFDRAWINITPGLVSKWVTTEAPALNAAGVPVATTSAITANLRQAGTGLACVTAASWGGISNTFALTPPTAINGITEGVFDFQLFVVGLDGQHFCDGPGGPDFVAPPVHHPVAKHPAKHKNSSSSNGLIYVLAAVLAVGLLVLIWAKRRHSDEPQQGETTEVMPITSGDKGADDAPPEAGVADPETVSSNNAGLENDGLHDGGAR